MHLLHTDYLFIGKGDVVEYPTVKTGVLIQKLTPANPANDRGKRTFEIRFPSPLVQETIYQRYANEHFGGHFHKGDDPSKNPEVFVLLSGRMEFCFKDKFHNERKELLDTSDGVPVMLIITPYIFHSARAINPVIYVEYRETYFDPAHPDCYPIDDF